MSSDDDRSSLGQLNDPTLKVDPGEVYYTSVEELELGKSWKNKSVLSIGDVKELWKSVKCNSHHSAGSEKKIFLHEILCGSELSIPHLEIPKRNPELEKRVTALRNQLEEKEYQRMTKNVNVASPYKSLQEDSIGYQMKQMNSGIIAVVQFVISLAAAFFFGFSGIQLFTGPMELAVRLLLGIASAIIIGVAELYVLVIHLDATEEQQKNNAKKSK